MKRRGCEEGYIFSHLQASIEWQVLSYSLRIIILLNAEFRLSHRDATLVIVADPAAEATGEYFSFLDSTDINGIRTRHSAAWREPEGCDVMGERLAFVMLGRERERGAIGGECAARQDKAGRYEEQSDEAQNDRGDTRPPVSQPHN